MSLTEQENQSDQEVKSASYEWNTRLASLEFFFTEYYTEITVSNIKKWLKDPNRFNKEIRALSRYMYSANGVYTNVIDYMTALPTLDRVIFSNSKNHSSSKENKQKFKRALEQIKDKTTTRDVIRKAATDGIAFYYFNVESAKNLPPTLSDYDIDQIQELNADEFNCGMLALPVDYCSIVGIKNGSYVVAFDLSYFDQFLANGLSLKLKRYPREIREKYKSYKKDISKKWAVLDNSKTVTIKVRANIEEKWGRPLGLAAFIDMLYEDYFTETKRGVLDDNNNNIIYQTFPEGDTKGTSALTKIQQEMQHNNIRNALFAKGNKKGVSFFSVAAGTKLDKVNTNVEILKVSSDDLIKKIATDLGFAGSALNGHDGDYSSQQTNLDLVAAEIFSWLEQLQYEYNKVINENIIKDKMDYVKVYYLPITYLNREKMISHMKELYTHGKGSLIAWISATGFDSDAYLSLMDYEIEEEFEEKYKPHITSFTATQEDIGRPSNDDPTNQNTIKSKSANSNNRPKPSV